MTGLTSMLGRGWRAHILLRAVLLAGLLIPFTAAAAQRGSWQVAAVTGPDDALVFCRAELLDAASGLTLAIALSPAAEVNVGVRVPDAGFTKGEGFDVQLALDNDWSKKVVAESAMDELLLIRLGKNDTFLKQLAKANTLRIVGDADATEFKLKGSAGAVQQLRTCVQAAAPAAPVPTSANTAGLPAGLQALLSAAQMKVTSVALPDVPGKAVDYAWTTTENNKTVEGGFREQANNTESLDVAVTKALDTYKQQCGAGNIKPGKAEKLRILSLNTANITCGGEFAAFLFYKTESGIFATMVHRGDKQSAQAARNKVQAVVRRLGNEQ